MWMLLIQKLTHYTTTSWTCPPEPFDAVYPERGAAEPKGSGYTPPADAVLSFTDNEFAPPPAAEQLSPRERDCMTRHYRAILPKRRRLWPESRRRRRPRVCLARSPSVRNRAKCRLSSTAPRSAPRCSTPATPRRSRHTARAGDRPRSHRLTAAPPSRPA